MFSFITSELKILLLLKRSTNELDTVIDRKEKIQVKYREWSFGEKEHHPNIKREKQASQLLMLHIKPLYFSHFKFDHFKFDLNSKLLVESENFYIN